MEMKIIALLLKKKELQEQCFPLNDSKHVEYFDRIQ